MSNFIFCWSLLWISFSAINVFRFFPSVKASKGVNVSQITALVNSSVHLPCEINLPTSSERVSLILWYREDVGIPIYSMELSEQPDTRIPSMEWSDKKWLGNRAQFQLDTQPASLQIFDVHPADSGKYRCRVDYNEAPTKNTLINLLVVVPPKELQIYDDTGRRRVAFVGPYSDKSSIDLYCDAIGGIPPPQVLWLYSGKVIDDSYELLSDGSVRNRIHIPNISRSYLKTELTCLASQTNVTASSNSTVYIDMTFPPVEVKIANKGDTLVVGRQAQLICRSYGSRPPAHLTWHLGGVHLNEATESTSSDGNTTVSILNFVVAMNHFELDLMCKASNPLIKEYIISDSFKLDLLYAPQVELSLGKSITASNIYEGGDVYFDCIVYSRPKANRILWRQNNQLLHHNATEGVILTNQSLVLQQVGRQKSGSYSCEAINTVGKGSSQSIFLDVKYSPVCQQKEAVVYGVGKGEVVDIYCAVMSNPEELTFQWTFNNTADFIRVPKERAVPVNRTTSKLTYIPRNNKDYGTLMCSASNEVGLQKVPCVYHIILAVAPDPPENCTIINKSSEAFHLQCIAGFDGGMKQHFFITVFDRKTAHIVFNGTVSDPELLVENLSAGSAYSISVTSLNEKGHSASVILAVETHRHPAVELTQAQGASKREPPSPNDAAKNLTQTQSSAHNKSEAAWVMWLCASLAATMMCGVAFYAVIAHARKRCSSGFYRKSCDMCSDDTVNNDENAGGAFSGNAQTVTLAPSPYSNGLAPATTILDKSKSSVDTANSFLKINPSPRAYKGILKRPSILSWQQSPIIKSSLKVHKSPPYHNSSSSFNASLSEQITDLFSLNLDQTPKVFSESITVRPEGFNIAPAAPPSTSSADDCQYCNTSTLPPSLRSHEVSSMTIYNSEFAISSTIPRRTSKEGTLNDNCKYRRGKIVANHTSASINDGSLDPLLRIPKELTVITSQDNLNLSGDMALGSIPVEINFDQKKKLIKSVKRKRESMV